MRSQVASGGGTDRHLPGGGLLYSSVLAAHGGTNGRRLSACFLVGQTSDLWLPYLMTLSYLIPVKGATCGGINGRRMTFFV